MNRRRFLQSTIIPLSVATSVMPGAAVANTKNAPCNAGSALSTGLSSHAGQAKIKDVEAYAVPGAIFAKVTDDSGNVGWGECGHDGEQLVVGVVKHYLRKRLIDEDVFNTEPNWARQFHKIDEIGPGGLASQAMAGVDAALWDLRGKLLGVPVYKLLGGKFFDKFPLYGSFSRSKGSGQYRTPKECAQYTEKLLEEGFKAVKLRLGIREENQDPANAPARACTQAVREVMGDDMPLYVDANNGYSPMRAIQIGKMLSEEFNVSVFEEPVAQYQYASLAKVADSLPMFIAGGEHEYTKWQFRDLIMHGKVSLLNPDVSKLAGITEAKKVAALAETFDLPMSVHNARPTLLTAAHFHYIVSCQTAHRPQEHPGNRRLSHLWKYFDNKIEVNNGYGQVSQSPGLGLIVNEKMVKKDQLT